MKLRCSELPLTFACPGSAFPAEGEILIDPVSEMAGLGSAVHEALAYLVSTGDMPDLGPIALKWDCDPDELGRLTAYGRKAWSEIGSAFPNAQTEQELDWVAGKIKLTGHADVLSFWPGWAAVVDWKSGYKQSDFYHQIMGYGMLATRLVPGVEKVRLSIVWLRDHTVDTFTVTKGEVYVWEEKLANEIVEWDGVYHPGKDCEFCPRFASCPARQALVRSAIAEVSGDTLPAILDPAHPETIRPAFVALHASGKLKLAKQVLERIHELIKADMRVNGPIDLGNGREYALISEPREEILPLEAWPIISEHLDEATLASCIKVGKTALLDAIAAEAPKGQKGKAKDQVMTELREAGAVREKTIETARERKKEA